MQCEVYMKEGVIVQTEGIQKSAYVDKYKKQVQVMEVLKKLKEDAVRIS